MEYLQNAQHFYEESKGRLGFQVVWVLGLYWIYMNQD
jgi:hypothetical protein